MKNYSLEPLRATVSVEEYVKTCVDVSKFLTYCRQCPNFGKIWACPPFSFDPMEIWASFQVLELYGLSLIPGKSMTGAELFGAFQTEKTALSQKVLSLESRVPGSLSLAASTCTCCSPCLRTQGKPCCHPEQMRPSIEALGGDVGLTMEKYLHKAILWMKDDKLPDYLTIMAGLLIKCKEK